MSAGPLTREQLMRLWRSVTDSAYNEALLEEPDSLIEAIEQAAEQFAEVSQLVDALTSALYIRPWSGQTAPPGSLEAHARVDVEVTRNRGLEFPLVFPAGFVVEQVLDDYSPDGSILVQTGRRYVVEETRAMMPGDPGPLVLRLRAEKAGATYNVPPPGTISLHISVGEGLANDGATVVPGTVAHQLRCREEPDVIAPSCVGSYVRFTAGANVGRSSLIVGFGGPVPGVTGGVAMLAADELFRMTAVSGSFERGELVAQAGAFGQVIEWAPPFLLVRRVTGSFVAGTLTGQTSLASGTAAIEVSAGLVAETATAAWEIVDVVDQYGLQFRNPAHPSGGRYGFLVETGEDRGVFLEDGETEEHYRERVANLPDVVSPNALVRQANSVLVPLGYEVCFREIGTDKFFGAFFDAGSSDDPVQNPARNFAFDMDFALRPTDRFKLMVSLAESRGFMLFGVPAPRQDWHASAFDAGPSQISAFDVQALFDGDPNLQDLSQTYRAVYNQIESAKLGGVGFDLYIEDQGCV